jgi:hypothetical protein
MRQPRVLCYAPYNRWIQHAAWEITIVHALRQRGADVRHVYCDALYPECDVFWAATDPRHPLACLQCQAEVSRNALSMQAPFEWLGRYVTPVEVREARRWAGLVPTGRLTTATCGDWPVGPWVESSVHSHLRLSDLPLDDPAVERAYRGYLEAGLVACFALTRLLDDCEPDVLFLFSGRMSSTRVAFELARRRGIRVVTHERGLLPQTLRLYENAHCLSLTPVKTLWRDWGDVPLTREETERIAAYMSGRAHGQGLSWPALSPPPQDPDDVRAALRLSAARPVWTVFTSTDDEVVAEGDWGGPFPGQMPWLERTIAWIARHPHIDLVIRVHPNTGGQRALGSNVGQLRAFESLARSLPGNVRLVMPDDPISSYSLMEITTVGLVYQSTVSLELACQGRTVVMASGSMVTGMPFVKTVSSADDYERLLDELQRLAPNAVFADVQRLAYRFAYAYYFRWTLPFPLVHMADNGSVRLAYQSPAELRPGRDANLDRVVRIVLDGEPVCPPPPAPAMPAPVEIDAVGPASR